jgi:hypothetical protein
MRKFALLLTIGLFLSAATANANDGTKTISKSHKGKKTCVCHGKCSKATAAKGSAAKGACTDPKCTKCGGKATSEKS